MHALANYTDHWGARVGFDVPMEFGYKSDECKLFDLDMIKTKLTVPQKAPGWKILSISEVTVEREQAPRPGCVSTYGRKDHWDKWNCHGTVMAEYGPPIP